MRQWTTRTGSHMSLTRKLLPTMSPAACASLQKWCRSHNFSSFKLPRCITHTSKYCCILYTSIPRTIIPNDEELLSRKLSVWDIRVSAHRWRRSVVSQFCAKRGGWEVKSCSSGSSDSFVCQAPARIGPIPGGTTQPPLGCTPVCSHHSAFLSASLVKIRQFLKDLKTFLMLILRIAL